jgi:hypothetical protein
MTIEGGPHNIAWIHPDIVNPPPRNELRFP